MIRNFAHLGHAIPRGSNGRLTKDSLKDYKTD
jgi:hypothetical protein